MEVLLSLNQSEKTGDVYKRQALQYVAAVIIISFAIAILPL